MNDQKSIIGLQVDNLKILQSFGAGGMASVYLASDVSLKVVAGKTAVRRIDRLGVAGTPA